MMSRRMVGVIVRTGRKSNLLSKLFSTQKMGEPTIYHALVVIFLEFFAWGLLTAPMIKVLNETFPEHTFLMNGLIMGIKGFLSFLSAPLIGALSDMWGRKFFLLTTVLFTCMPIPFMIINSTWYFGMLAISGMFAVTFSVVFAYVADVTTQSERSAAYGLVSATFAASLVTSPALGAYLSQIYSDNLVIVLATFIAAADVAFILLFVPESLPDKLRITSNQSLWETADPFQALKKVGRDRKILMLCIAVFLSYLPEAGQYSCFFVYLKLVIGFSQVDVALFIAIVGLLSVIAQTGVLAFLQKTFNSKATIMIGLALECLQLLWYGFGSQNWMMWFGGVLAAFSSITYPAISSYVSMYADPDKQGLVQGMITGMRGLCNGLGPAVFGLIFSLFHVDLKDQMANPDLGHHVVPNHRGHYFPNGTLNTLRPNPTEMSRNVDEVLVPGPPFVFGAFMVLLAMLVTAFIPELIQYHSKSTAKPKGDMFGYGKARKGELSTDYYYTNVEEKEKKEDDDDLGHIEINDKNSDSGSETPSRSLRDSMSSERGSALKTPLDSKAVSNRKRLQSSACELQIPLMADTDDHC